MNVYSKTTPVLPFLLQFAWKNSYQRILDKKGGTSTKKGGPSTFKKIGKSSIKKVGVLLTMSNQFIFLNLQL